MGTEKVTDTTEFPDDGLEALERFVKPDTLAEIDAHVIDRFSPDQAADFLNLPDFYESSPFLVETLHGSRLVTQPSSSISSTSSPQSSAPA